jgi:hypothetical protein
MLHYFATGAIRGRRCVVPRLRGANGPGDCTTHKGGNGRWRKLVHHFIIIIFLSYFIVAGPMDPEIARHIKAATVGSANVHVNPLYFMFCILFHFLLFYFHFEPSTFRKRQKVQRHALPPTH